ncbi:MAG: hypothetical protein NC821_05590, partial [Candidatus Omnitrophica bacterium]|nr:hypothetical protein [Candidatus Omnitrophota bacterium]
MKKIIFFCVIFVLFKEDSVLARRVREINPLRQIAAVVGETNAQTILGIVQRYSSSPQQIRDNLVNFYTFISQEFVPRGWWDERSLVFQRIMVEIFSHGLGKASYLLVEPDFEKKVGLLNYKSLLGLLN